MDQKRIESIRTRTGNLLLKRETLNLSSSASLSLKKIPSLIADYKTEGAS